MFKHVLTCLVLIELTIILGFVIAWFLGGIWLVDYPGGGWTWFIPPEDLIIPQ